jgi:DNA polymerase-3 subunit gamma/tau
VLLAILEACVAGDAAAALEAAGRAAAGGAEAKRLGEDLLQYLRDLVVLRVAPDVPDLVEGSDEEIAELRALAARVDAARLRRMFRALVREQEDLAWAPRPFAVLELALVRLATLPAGDDVGQLLARLDALERRLGGGAASDPGGGAAPTGPARPGRRGGARRESGAGAPEAGPERAGAPGAADASARALEPGPLEVAAADGGPPPDEPPPLGGPPVAVAHAPGASPPPGAPEPPPADAPLAVVFDRLRAFAGRENRGLAAALAGGRLVERSAERLRIAAPNRFAAERLADRRVALEATCARFFGRPLRVEIETRSDAPAPIARPEDREAARRLRERALEHPAVNAALEVLEAKILDIRPPPGVGGSRGS